MKIRIAGGQIINEGKRLHADIWIENGKIIQIGGTSQAQVDHEINAEGKIVIPGLIDDQVHFREPGLTHKATIHTESKAAVAGGVTTFFEMPNTVPNATRLDLLENKYQIAADTSVANYSFFMGVTNDNFEEVRKTPTHNICGLKIFMGSSTGNMLVDSPEILERVFSEMPHLIATHCEDEATVRARTAWAKDHFTGNLPFDIHAQIRNEEACLKSSSMAIDLAEKLGTRLHVLHISTEEEVALFRNKKSKNISSEVCVHHLYFDAEDYKKLGNFIKCNPAIKEKRHKEALRKALEDDVFDVVATDHAPHTLEEKLQDYFQAPSGLPLVQHSLQTLIDLGFSLEKIVQKTSHSVADLFRIKDRGYIREGYWADLAVVDLAQSELVTKATEWSKCGWSPFEGKTFGASITDSLVSGQHVYSQGQFLGQNRGQRVEFLL